MAGDGRGPAAIEYRRSFESQPPEAAARPMRPGRGDRRATGNGCAPRSGAARGPGSRCARASSTAASAWPARTATSSSCSVGDLPARGYASHGESWSLALALRLASFDLLRAGREDPVLILDDVFAELDTGRRDRLAALVAAAEQVLVTAAVPEDIPGILTGAHFKVAGGTLTEVPGAAGTVPAAVPRRGGYGGGLRPCLAGSPGGHPPGKHQCALTPSAPGWPPRRWPGREPTPGRGGAPGRRSPPAGPGRGCRTGG